MRLSFKGAVGVEPATVPVAPNNAAIAYSDFAGTLTTTLSAARIVRTISDGQGFEFCVPGARGRINVTLAALGQIIVNLNYTGLVTRTDTYNDIGSFYVDGVYYGDFVCPTPRVPSTAHAVASTAVSLTVAAGSHLIEWVLPYCASVDFTGLLVPATAAIAAPAARPAKAYAVFGDSRVHGFSVSKGVESWTAKLGVTKSARIRNLGYGGRQIVAADGTTAGALGAAGAVYLAGYNDFSLNGGNLATIQATYQSVITNYRAAATAAGAPTSKLVMLSDIDAPNAYGAGPLAGNSPTLQAFRNTMAAAVTAAADADCVFLSGNTGGMPTGAGSFPDGVHPNDAASTTIAGLVAAVMP